MEDRLTVFRKEVNNTREGKSYGIGSIVFSIIKNKEKIEKVNLPDDFINYIKALQKGEPLYKIRVLAFCSLDTPGWCVGKQCMLRLMRAAFPKVPTRKSISRDRRLLRRSPVLVGRTRKRAWSTSQCVFSTSVFSRTSSFRSAVSPSMLKILCGDDESPVLYAFSASNRSNCFRSLSVADTFGWRKPDAIR